MSSVTEAVRVMCDNGDKHVSFKAHYELHLKGLRIPKASGFVFDLIIRAKRGKLSRELLNELDSSKVRKPTSLAGCETSRLDHKKTAHGRRS